MTASPNCGLPTDDRSAHVRVDGLTKWYQTRGGTQVHALHDVNLEIREHEFVALLGASGCGKSTLLKIVAGLIPPTEGVVEVAGRVVDGPRQDYGYVFQEALLLPWRTVLSNILLVAEVQHRDRAVTRARALELLDLVGLAGFENKYPYELSGGMQQRVSVVRSLVNDPTLLLMDEPFAALDALTRESMSFELLRIWSQERKTIVFVTHSISEAVLLADRVVTMSPRPGRITSVVNVPLPRPRLMEHMSTSGFADTVGRLRAGLYESGGVE